MSKKEKKVKKVKPEPVKKKDYIVYNGKIDSFSEVVDTTVETGKKVSKEVEKKYRSFYADFKKFVAKGNVVDLAVAVVVGAAFNKIVSSLVSGIITPLTSMLLRTDNLAELKYIMRPAIEADEAAGIEAVSEIALQYGVVIQATLDFLVIALSIYFTLKVFMRLKNSINRKERLAAEARAKEIADKKKAEAEAEAAHQEQIKKDFLEDVAVQADVLNDIKEIMLRMEKRQLEK